MKHPLQWMLASGPLNACTQVAIVRYNRTWTPTTSHSSAWHSSAFLSLSRTNAVPFYGPPLTGKVTNTIMFALTSSHKICVHSSTYTPIWWSHLWSCLEVHALCFQTNTMHANSQLKEWPLCRENTYQWPCVYIWVNDVILRYGHSTNFIGVINLGMMNYSVANKSKL